MNRAISRFTGWVIIRHPGAIALLMLVAIAFSAWRVSYLHINYNQLDLIPQELPAVQSTREMIDLLGGVGYLLFAMESDDLDHMKEVADDLGARFRKIPGVHKVSFKQDVSFVQQKIALFAEPEDLKEGYKRVRRKIRSIIAKNNPFHIQLTEAKEVELNLDDLVDKYRRLSKRAIDDDYNVDPKKEMIMMVIKPSGAASDLAFTRKLLENFNLAIAEFNADNKLKAKVIEYYGDESRPEGATVTFGYAGGYKSTLDDSDTIREALAPTSLVAFFGIFFYLLFFLRRPFQILLLMSVLVASVLMTFAFAELTIGELNTITALLGAILMGIGIDYGIHFLYRLREEYSHDQNLERAIQDAVEHSGSASLASALTTTAALYILSMADFRGFSDFGIIMGTGVLITAAMMYTAIPVVYLLIDRIAPSFKNHLLMKAAKESDDELKNKPFPWARPILLGTVALTVVLAFFATQVTFDYNTRSLMSADRPSLVLQDEINERYQISADPIAVFTPTIEEARAIYDQLVPLKEDSTIDFVVSLYSLVPDPEKQKANRKTLDKLERQVSQLDPSMLDEEQAKALEKAKPYLKAQPFGLDDLPESTTSQFKPVPSANKQGYLTYIYPKVSLWESKDLLRFVDEVGKFEIGDKTYYSAGMAVLYAELAQIVLNDGIRLTILSIIAIFIIIFFNFGRHFRAALLAMLPLATGMLWMLGLMALTGWRINFMNIVVFPLVFGYGISAGIHLYHRYLEAGSALLSVKRTGSAVAASSITTLVGWASLLVSGHSGLTSMGILASFGIASSLVVSLTILPAVLELFGSKIRHPREPGAKMESA